MGTSLCIVMMAALAIWCVFVIFVFVVAQLVVKFCKSITLRRYQKVAGSGYRKRKIYPTTTTILSSDLQKSPENKRFVMVYNSKEVGSPKDFFESFNVPLDELCFDFAELVDNVDSLLTLAGKSFVSLYKEKNEETGVEEYFVYYAFRSNDYDSCNSNICSLEKNSTTIKPSKNFGIIVPKLK